jgi:hypothetical protein
MTVSYFLCTTHKLYEKEYKATQQTMLTDAEGFTLYEGEPSTWITPQVKSIHPSFKTFICKHELKEKVNGIVYGREFNHYLKPYEFSLFHNYDSELSLIRLNTDAAEDFVKTLNEEKLYKFDPLKINFEFIIAKSIEVSSLWVSQINSLNLSSAGYFGSDVHRDPDVQEMIKNGELSYIQIKYIYNDKNEYTIGISKRGSITIYNTLENKKKELDIAFDIYRKLLTL